jgi:hypothetical protein
MRNRFTATLIALFSVFLLHAQQSSYFGVRTEVSLIQPRLSLPTNINSPVAIGVGVGWNYPFTSQLEMTIDGMVSFYSLNADARAYGNNGLESIGNQSMSITAYDFTYTLLKGFGEEQHFKVGAGIYYGKASSSNNFDSMDRYWGNAPEANENYNMSSVLKQGGNYGVAIEALYNINDAFQVSLRYRFGLANLNSQSTPSWQQNALGLNGIYYFGADKRGSSKVSKKGNKKYKW